MTLLEKIGTPIGSYAPDFELRGIDDQVHHLARYLEKFRAVGIVFMGNHCPCVQLYIDRLKKIQESFHHTGFTLIGINPNDATQDPDESFDNMKSFGVRGRFNFPYLSDSTQDVTRSFGAQKTPTVFLIDSKCIVRYKGGIDDNAQKPEAVQMHYLRDAVSALLTGSLINLTSTEPVGEGVKWRK